MVFLGVGAVVLGLRQAARLIVWTKGNDEDGEGYREESEKGKGYGGEKGQSAVDGWRNEGIEGLLTFVEVLREEVDLRGLEHGVDIYID